MTDPTLDLAKAYLASSGDVQRAEKAYEAFVLSVLARGDREGRAEVQAAAARAQGVTFRAGEPEAVFALRSFRSLVERAKAVARKVSLAVAEKISDFAAKHFRAPEPEELEAWSTNRTRQVQDANHKEAYTEGQFNESLKPSVSRFIAGFEVVGSDDENTRRGREVDHGENHLAALGLIAETTDPVWSTTTPIYGFGCRHFLRSITRPEARRKGWLDDNGRMPRREPAGFSAYNPAPGFGHG